MPVTLPELTRIDPGVQKQIRERYDTLKAAMDTSSTPIADLASDYGHASNERVLRATMLLDAGASLTIRDSLLQSTPLGWACRWGRLELVKLLLKRGADPVEADAEPWATPRAWADKMGHAEILAELEMATADGADQ